MNRCLATLKRALRLAYRWQMIDRVPQISLLKGERQKDTVLYRWETRAGYRPTRMVPVAYSFPWPCEARE
ncbi:MAG: hypothetical protein ACHP78_07440 [Terriglobales bacterium]